MAKSKSKANQAYYYDGAGSRIALHAIDEIAIDWEAAKAVSLPDELVSKLRDSSRVLRGGVSLVERNDLGESALHALDSVGAIHPVFRAEDGTKLVVLPEVRVEATDASQARKIKRTLKREEAELVEATGERLVIRPKSGRGSDALDLANRLEEAEHPLMAQAHFLRVVPRPETVPGGPVRARSAR